MEALCIVEWPSTKALHGNGLVKSGYIVFHIVCVPNAVHPVLQFPGVPRGIASVGCLKASCFCSGTFASHAYDIERLRTRTWHEHDHEHTRSRALTRSRAHSSSFALRVVKSASHRCRISVPVAKQLCGWHAGHLPILLHYPPACPFIS